MCCGAVKQPIYLSIIEEIFAIRFKRRLNTMKLK